MKKIENLNNTRKTVLRLEKEINAISNNLSKVKNKDHTTMKKIINNINYLLTKDSFEKKINKKEETLDKEESKKTEESKILENFNLNNQYAYNSDRNIDYLLLLNKHKNNNNEKNNRQYFNKKSSSSSKINVQNSSNKKSFFKSYNINLNTNANGKENNIMLNRNKIIEDPNNFLNKTNQMTYSKPRLLTEYSKRNSSNNINIGNKNNTSYKNKNFGKQIKNIKYLSYNKNINHSSRANNKYKKDSVINTLYYNYRDKTENNFMKNNYLNYNNKTTFSYEQPDLIINNENNLYEKEEHKYENEKDLQYTIKKNKKSNLEKKGKQIQEIIINSNINNNFINTPHSHYKLKNGYENNKKFHNINVDYDYSSKNNISEKLIKRDNDNDIFPYNVKNEHLINKNNIENIFNTCGPYKTQRKRRIKENNYYTCHNSTIRKSINKNFMNDNEISNTDNINYLLNILNANDINEAIIKVNVLLDYEKDIYMLKQLYNNNEKNNFEINDLWISNFIKSYKRNEKYKNLCQNIMILQKIKSFEEFKIFIKEKLSKNKKDNSTLNENEDYLNINPNDRKYKNIKNINIIDSNMDKFSVNSDDIKYSNSNKLKVINDYMYTHY